MNLATLLGLELRLMANIAGTKVMTASIAELRFEMTKKKRENICPDIAVKLNF